MTTVNSGCWMPTSVCALTTPLHRLIIQFAQTVTVESTRCHCWELQNQLFAFCGGFCTASIFSNSPSIQHALDRFCVAGDQAGIKIRT